MTVSGTLALLACTWECLARRWPPLLRHARIGLRIAVVWSWGARRVPLSPGGGSTTRTRTLRTARCRDGACWKWLSRSGQGTTEWSAPDRLPTLGTTNAVRRSFVSHRESRRKTTAFAPSAGRRDTSPSASPPWWDVHSLELWPTLREGLSLGDLVPLAPNQCIFTTSLDAAALLHVLPAVASSIPSSTASRLLAVRHCQSTTDDWVFKQVRARLPEAARVDLRVQGVPLTWRPEDFAGLKAALRTEGLLTGSCTMERPRRADGSCQDSVRFTCEHSHDVTSLGAIGTLLVTDALDQDVEIVFQLLGPRFKWTLSPGTDWSSCEPP